MQQYTTQSARYANNDMFENLINSRRRCVEPFALFNPRTADKACQCLMARFIDPTDVDPTLVACPPGHT